MSKTIRVELSTVEYEFAHGKKPRGFGQWVFLCPEFLGGQMTIRDNYAAARRTVFRAARHLGAVTITVEP